MQIIGNLINKQKIISYELFLKKLINLKGSRIFVQNMVKTIPDDKDICVATYHFTLNDAFDEEIYILLMQKKRRLI